MPGQNHPSLWAPDGLGWQGTAKPPRCASTRTRSAATTSKMKPQLMGFPSSQRDDLVFSSGSIIKDLRHQAILQTVDQMIPYRILVCWCDSGYHLL
jgi:hypothetical protein